MAHRRCAPCDLASTRIEPRGGDHEAHEWSEARDGARPDPEDVAQEAEGNLLDDLHPFKATRT